MPNHEGFRIIPLTEAEATAKSLDPTYEFMKTPIGPSPEAQRREQIKLLIDQEKGIVKRVKEMDGVKPKRAPSENKSIS